MSKEELNYIQDVPIEFDPLTGKIQGFYNFDNLKSLNIGKGTNVIKGSLDGLWLGSETFSRAPFRVNMAGSLTATSGYVGNSSNGWSISSTGLTGQANSVITGGKFQTAASGQRIVIDSADNYIRFYDSDGNFVASLGGSSDATNRVLDTTSSQDIIVARILSSHLTTTNLTLQVSNKGLGINTRLTNENTDSARTTAGTAILDINQLGTGTGIKIGDNNPDSTGIPLHISSPNKTTNNNPSIKIQRSIGGAHINFASDSTAFVGVDGDLSFDGSDLYLMIGTSTFRIVKVAV